MTTHQEFKGNGQTSHPVTNAHDIQQQDVEVQPKATKAKRRAFKLEYKRRILKELDACTEEGQHSNQSKNIFII